MINSHDFRLTGVVERDPQDGHSITETKSQQQSNGNDSISIPTSRQQEPGLIRYIWDDKEAIIQFSTTNISNTATLYCGDKVNETANIDIDNSNFNFNIILG